MFRVWIWIMAIGLVFADGVWTSAVGGLVGDLSKINSLCVFVENLGIDAKRAHHLSEEIIQKHIYIWLKGKLPKVQTVRHTGRFEGLCGPKSPTLSTLINIITSETASGKRKGFSATVEIFLTRGTLWDSGKKGLGIAYLASIQISGSMVRTRPLIKNAIERLLADFAAEYYKAGNR